MKGFNQLSFVHMSLGVSSFFGPFLFLSFSQAPSIFLKYVSTYQESFSPGSLWASRGDVPVIFRKITLIKIFLTSIFYLFISVYVCM